MGRGFFARDAARKEVLAGFAAVLACSFWGVSFLAPRALWEASPIEIGTMRFLFFGVSSVFLWSHSRVRRRLEVSVLRDALYLSLLGYGGYYLLLVYAGQTIGVVTATAIVGLLPLTISLVGTPIQRWKSLSAAWLLIVLGMGFLFFELNQIHGERPRLLFSGLGAAFLALASWTVFALMNARWLRIHRDWTPVQWTCLLGIGSALSSVLFFLLFEGEWKSMLNSRFLLWTGFMGIIGSWVASALWNYASIHLGNGVLGILLVFESIFGIFYGWFYERIESGRSPSFLEIVSVALLLGGAVTGLRGLKKTQVEA